MGAKQIINVRIPHIGIALKLEKTELSKVWEEDHDETPTANPYKYKQPFIHAQSTAEEYK